MLTRSRDSNKELNESLIETLKSKHILRKKQAIISSLLARGADINHVNCLGNTPLHLASNTNEVYLLFMLGANANIQNYVGETPLLHIIKKDRSVPVDARKKRFKQSKEIIKEFIRFSYRNRDLNMNLKDSKGNSPLFEYVFKNECDINIVKQFVHLRADLNIKSSSRNTLLHAAVSNFYCKNDVVQYLLEQGLHPNAENIHKQTPLHCCLRNSNIKLDIVEELIKHGADVMKSDVNGNIPFYNAVLNRHCSRELMDLLLNGIDPSFLNRRLRSGDTLLHQVVTRADVNVIEKFLSCGADVNARDSTFCTPLHLAVGMPNCDERIVSILVKYGADVNAKNHVNSTPLHIAFENTRNMAVIKTLLWHKAKMCTLDNSACTPLHYLIRNPHFEPSFLIELLSTEKSIEACLKLTASNRNFLHMCFLNRKRSILRILLKYFFLKHHTRISERKFPLVVEIFLDKLEKFHWNIFNDFYLECMMEINRMKLDIIAGYIKFYSLMVNKFSLLAMAPDHETKKQVIDAVLVRMTKDLYPIYKDMVMYVRKQDFYENLDAVRVCTRVYRDGSLRRINLPQFAVRHIAEYLSRQDVINLILAYSNSTDSFESEADMSFEEENVSVSSENEIDLTREVTVQVSRLSQMDLRKLCKPCRVVIKNDIETKLLITNLENEQYAGSSSLQNETNLISCEDIKDEEPDVVNLENEQCAGSSSLQNEANLISCEDIKVEEPDVVCLENEQGSEGSSLLNEANLSSREPTCEPEEKVNDNSVVPMDH